MMSDINSVPFLQDVEDCKCGCGKEGRYICHDDNGNSVYSCNKYQRCPTYEDLYKMYEDLKGKFIKLKNASEDILIFREGTDYYKQAEQIIKEMK